MSESYIKITEPGIASPKYDPKSIKGSDLHKEMLMVTSNNFYRASIKFLTHFQKYLLAFYSKYQRLRYKQLVFQRYFPLKLLNFIFFLIERKRFSKVHYLPFFVSFEICSFCNLRCPGCLTGLRDPEARARGKTTLERIKPIIDQVARKSIQINLFNNGEPLLNEEFYSICAYAVKKGLWTVTDTNLNIRDNDLAHKIIDSKLHKLTVSCDGATQEVYEMYRRGGDVDLVFDNIQKIAAEKKRRKLVFPWITAKFIVFDHNWHECKLFRERALAACADEVLFVTAGMGGLYKTRKVSTAKAFNLKELKWEIPKAKTCEHIWDTFIVDYDGGLYPCCICFRDDDLFVGLEDANKMKLIEQWNNDIYTRVRNFFLDKSMSDLDKLPQPCNSCKRCLDHVLRRCKIH